MIYENKPIIFRHIFQCLGVYWPTFFTGVYAMIAMIIATLLVTIIIKEKFDNVANKFEQALKDSGLF